MLKMAASLLSFKVAIPFICALIAASPVAADDSALWRELRKAASSATSLEPFQESGNPRFQTIRLNVTPTEIGGQRYGMIKLKVPAEAGRSLVWMFSDVANIVQYELMPLTGGEPIRGNQRVIYPALAGL